MRDPICVMEMGGKGKGLLLHGGHQMEAGDVIFSERVVMKGWGVDFGEQLSTWAQQFLSLPPAHQAAVLALHANEKIEGKETSLMLDMCNPLYRSPDKTVREYSEEEVKAIWSRNGVNVPTGMMADTLQAIRVMKTNSFSWEYEKYSVLFLTLSRVNHSCEPNCIRVERKVGNDDVWVDIVALRNISDGEELTISYLADNETCQSWARRQSFLQGWKFTCCCAACSRLVDVYRAFACPSDKGCKGTVRGLNGRTSDLSSCDKCGSSPSQAACERLLAAETLAIKELERLEKVCMTPKFNPQDLPKALLAAKKGGLTTEHWTVQALCDTNFDFFRQVKDYRAADVHITNRLSFWDAHLTRASVRRAWIREARADNLVRMGHFKEAFELYEVTLGELMCLRPDDTHRDLQDVQKSIEKVLRGDANV